MAGPAAGRGTGERAVLVDVEAIRAAVDARRKSAVKLQRYAQENHLAIQEPRLLGRHIPGWHEWPEVEQLAADMVLMCDWADGVLSRHVDEYEDGCVGCGFDSQEERRYSWPDCPEILAVAAAFKLGETP